MRMSRNGFIIHFIISLKPDRLYKATVVYSDIPRQTVVYQLYATAQGFDVTHAKCYICLYTRRHTYVCILDLQWSLPLKLATVK